MSATYQALQKPQLSVFTDLTKITEMLLGLSYYLSLEFISDCNGLKKKWLLKLSGTTRRCGLVGVDVILLEDMCHCGGGF